MSSRFTSSAKYRHITAVCLRLCLLASLLFSSSPFAAPPTEEYKLKSALIYKLTKFIEWPTVPTGSFGICLLGEDPFGDALDPLTERQAKNRPIKIHRHTQSETVDEHCQIVFISDSKQPFIESILEKLSSRPILSISDMNNFAQQGGMLEFTRGERRIGFTINLKSARRAQLTIAAPLLELATLIESTPQSKTE